MTNSYLEWRDGFRDAVTQFLWDQWSLVGMAGNRSSGCPVDFIVDPEALFLATTRFARSDSRFLHEVLDWLFLNGGSLVSQRIRNLQGSHGFGCTSTLLEFDTWMRKARPRNWRSLESLDDGLGTAMRPTVLQQDYEPRGLSTKPDPSRPEAFLFTLRSLFGGSARVEVIAWLLTHDGGYPAEIARETAWNPKSIQQILNDLEDSGLVDAERREREKRFRLDRPHWLRWLRPDRDRQGRDDLRWRSQAPLYVGCCYIERILDRLVAMPEASERLLAITIREMAAERASKEIGSMAAAFDLAGFGFLFQGLPKATGTDLVQRFEAGVEALRTALSVRVSG